MPSSAFGFTSPGRISPVLSFLGRCCMESAPGALGPAELEASNAGSGAPHRPRVPGNCRVAQGRAKSTSKPRKEPEPGSMRLLRALTNPGASPTPGTSADSNTARQSSIHRGRPAQTPAERRVVRTGCRREGGGGEGAPVSAAPGPSPPVARNPPAGNRRPLRTTRAALSAAPAPPASRPSSRPPGPSPRPCRRAAPRGPRRRRPAAG